MSDDLQLLRDELEASSDRIGYLEERVRDLQNTADRRYQKITDLEEEIEELQENLADLEAKIAGRACLGRDNCGLESE